VLDDGVVKKILVTVAVERELQGTGQVNWGPVSEKPSSAVVRFTAVPSEISRVRP
jgi:hypothetical protein